MKRETINQLKSKGLKLKKCADGYILTVTDSKFTVEVNYGVWRISGSSVTVSDDILPGQVLVYDEFSDPHYWD